MTDYLDDRVDFEKDSRIQSVFDEVSLWSSRFGAFLLNQIDLKRGISVLDIPCGAGFPLFELAHMHGQSCRFAGMDLLKGSLERAALKRSVYGLSNVLLTRADGEKIPFKNDSFDLIVSVLGHNNFANPRAVYAECARVAKTGARIVLATNCKGHMKEFYDEFRETLYELKLASRLPKLDANENHRGTMNSLSEDLESAGFSISKIMEEKFQMRFLDGTSFLRNFLTRLGFLDGWRAVVDPADEKRVFKQIEERLNDIAAKNGEMRVTIPMLYVEGKK